MDYLYRPVSYTPSRAAIDPDGKVRLVLSHDDPGYHNWIDTQGFARGNVTYRNLMTSEQTDLRTRVVARVALADAMPVDSARIDRAGRVRQLRERFAGVRMRYRI